MDQLAALVLLIPALLLLTFWMWMFRDMVNNGRLPGTEKTYWAFAFAFLNIFAAIWYYFAEYRER
jgi:hypothetical protein